MKSASHVAAGLVQYLVAQTLDGYIAESDGRLEWLIGPEQGAAGAEADATTEATSPTIEDASVGEANDSYERFFEQVGALAMGSKTYQGILKRYPERSPYGNVPSWVFTTADLMPPREYGDIRRADGPVRPVLDHMRNAAGGRNIWVVGGGELATQFADSNLLDELLVTIVPVVLGTGVPTFARRMDSRLVLTNAAPAANGAVELRYRFAHSIRDETA